MLCWKKTHFIRVVTTGLALYVSLCLTNANGLAQSNGEKSLGNPVVRLEKRDLGSFRVALEALAAQAAVTFVAEGRPHKATLPNAEVPNLRAEGMPLNEAVAKLAAAYDYTAERRDATFIFRKRYTALDDVPNVTLEECALSVRDVARLLAPFDAKMAARPLRDNPAITGLISSLTPEQTALMRGGLLPAGGVSMAGKIDAALPISSLAPAQQQLIQQLALHFFTKDAIKESDRAAAEIARIVKDDTVFRWGDVRGIHFLGYESPQVPQSPGLVPLSNPNRIGTQRGHLFTVRTSTREDVDVDPTAPPTITPSSAAERAAGSPDEPATLGTAIAEIEQRQAKSSEALTLVVDDALAAKPVLLVGGERQTSQSLMRALAEVYDLRLITEKDGPLRITRRPARPAADLSMLHPAMVRALPGPLVRALHLASETNKDARVRDAKSRGELLSKDRLKTMRQASVRQLRVDIEPKMAAAPDRSLRLSASGDRADAAFATALIADYLNNLGVVIGRTLPATLTKSNQLHLVGGTYDHEGMQVYALFLSVPSSDGKRLVTGPGVVMRYPFGSASTSLHP